MNINKLKNILLGCGFVSNKPGEYVLDTTKINIYEVVNDQGRKTFVELISDNIFVSYKGNYENVIKILKGFGVIDDNTIKKSIRAYKLKNILNGRIKIN